MEIPKQPAKKRPNVLNWPHGYAHLDRIAPSLERWHPFTGLPDLTLHDWIRLLFLEVRRLEECVRQIDVRVLIALKEKSHSEHLGELLEAMEEIAESVAHAAAYTQRVCGRLKAGREELLKPTEEA
jgi:hypothetical protein